MLMIPHFSIFSSPWTKKVLNNLLSLFKEAHTLGDNQTQRAGNQLHMYMLAVQSLTVHIDDVLIVE